MLLFLLKPKIQYSLIMSISAMGLILKYDNGIDNETSGINQYFTIQFLYDAMHLRYETPKILCKIFR